MSCAPMLRLCSVYDVVERVESGRVKWRRSDVTNALSPAFAHLLNPSRSEMAKVFWRR